MASPANEPGSSIMPGRVNPTQQEVMVCLQGIGGRLDERAAVGTHSWRRLRQTARYSIEGTSLDRDRVEEYVQRSLMLATALSPHIGYDKASAIAHKADGEGITLREAAPSMGVSAADFDRIVNPKTMVGNPRRDLGLGNGTETT